MRGRRADVDLIYNGAAVNTQMADFKGGITYTDPASGEADTIDLGIHDRSGQWMTAWMPIQGDTIVATIKVTDWDAEGDNRELPCGFFILDDFTFSGPPTTGTISGISTPSEGAFKALQRSKTWENVTIQEVGKEVAARAGIELVWDVEGEPVTLASVEQSEQTDCDLITELCATYGYSVKVYAKKLVVFDREAYKAKDTVGIIRETDIKTWAWNRTLAGTYTGGEYAYTDPASEEDMVVSVGMGTRILKVTGKADSKADAQRKIQAAVDNANHGAVTLSVTMQGNARWVASQCITVTGLGKLSGKYYIDRITHTLGQGYEMALDLSLVANMTEEVVLDAIARLVAVGVINTPAYWEQNYEAVAYLDGLLVNMATRIKANLGGSSITEVPAALDVLTREGVINSPNYWASKYTALTWLGELIIKAANALTE